MDVDLGGRRLPLSATQVRGLARFVLSRERTHTALLSIAFVSRGAIASMNRRHLGRKGSTDVISFSLARMSANAPLIGDIYIAPDVVREQARRLGVLFREELARVIVHGVLHATGREHPEDRGRESSPMWKRQEKTLALAHSQGVW